MKQARLAKGFWAASFMLFTSVAIAGPNKVQICHLPPDNPENFHTITVSEKALPAHLAHGDLPGSCFENAEALCDDGNACTIDAMDAATETCLPDHPPVDCDDGLVCTSDSCDPANGCQYAPIVCDDGDLCTVDACNPFDGQCTSSPIDCGSLGICLPDTGQCDYPCDGINCEPADQCHAAGECVLPGECLQGEPLPDGALCDDGFEVTHGDLCAEGMCFGCRCFGTDLIDSFDWNDTGGYPFEGIECVNDGYQTMIRSKALHPEWGVLTYRIANIAGLVCQWKETMFAPVLQNGDPAYAPAQPAACRAAILQSQAWATHCGN